jgi:methylmalonyl-CoA mutase
MTTRRDPWVNLLRTTVAAFGAAAGGADAITVVPFDAAVGRPDAFGRRLARNIQALLLEESSLGRVIDPAGGSWFVERLTDDVSEAAWTWFRELEAVGGAIAALADGTIAERVAATRARRNDAIAHRTEPLTGVSEFPNVDEEPLVRDSDPGRPGGGLPRVRYAESFEALRDAADAAAAQGSAPMVRLLTVGTVADSTARATFAKNFFEAGGIRTKGVAVANSAEVAAAIEDDVVVCLCSSDRVYADQAVAVAQAAKAAGASRVLLAGAPGANEDAWRSAGVDEFIYVGVDVLTVLDRTLTHLGVRA